MPGPRSDETHEIEWAGRRLQLRGDGAIFERAHATAYVADVHLGKAGAYRAAGVPAPGGVDDAGFARLDVMLSSTSAERLVILGDLFHAKAGRTAGLDEAFIAWRRRWASVSMVLVRGNHDRGAGDPPTAAAVQCVDEPWVDPETGGAAAHDPAAVSAAPVVCGHVHPCVSFRVAGGRLRARCFVVGPRRLIAPAFGVFTGGARVSSAEDDRLFALVDGGVTEVTGLAAGGRRAGAR